MTDRLAPEFRGAQFGFPVTSLRLAVLAAALLFPCAPFPGWASDLRPFEGSAKPAFSLPDLAGNDVALDALRGRILLVHFFATWCEPCRQEIPALDRLSRRAKPNAAIVAISVADNEMRLRQFFTQTPVGFPVLQDRDQAIAKSWNVSALPTTYVLGADQKPIFFVETDFPWDTINVDPVTNRLIGNNLPERETLPDNLSQRRGP